MDPEVSSSERAQMSIARFTRGVWTGYQERRRTRSRLLLTVSGYLIGKQSLWKQYWYSGMRGGGKLKNAER